MEDSLKAQPEHAKTHITKAASWVPVWNILLILVLGLSVYFRFTGLFWGDYQYMHPDERFLIWVATDIRHVSSLAEYFNSASSTLNPQNVGHGFYVYGTWPVIATHFLAKWGLSQVGWQECLQMGRILSALCDLLTVFLVYLIGKRIFDRRVGVIGAAFSAGAVLQIQQSHFFTVDAFATTFSTLALYFAVVLASLPVQENGNNAQISRKGLLTSVWFGISVALAMSCKINTAPVAFLLPAAWAIRLLRSPHGDLSLHLRDMVRDLVVGGIVALIAVRILLPYAFEGPSFFNIIPSERWVANIKDLAAQTSGDVDFPPALQWARRPVTFSFQNMVLWGLGLPLGLLSWGGFLWLGWRIFRGREPNALLMWVWTAVYFIWQSLQGNPTMRYQMPIYPTLAVMGGWVLLTLSDRGEQARQEGKISKGNRLRVAGIGLGVVTLLATFTWAFAFTRIYTESETRTQASRWILANVPGAVNLKIKVDGDIVQQPLPYAPTKTVASGELTTLSFTADQDGILNKVFLTKVVDFTYENQAKTLQVVVVDGSNPEGYKGYGSLTGNFSNSDQPPYGIEVDLNLSMPVNRGKIYTLQFSVLEDNSAFGFEGPVAINLAGIKGNVRQYLPSMVDTIQRDKNQQIRFTALYNGELTELFFFRVLDSKLTGAEQTLRVELFSDQENRVPIASGNLTSTFLPADGDMRGNSYSFQFEQPINLVQGQNYSITLELTQGSGELLLSAAAPANESSWDVGLPNRLDGYDPFGGIYPGDLNFEMYYGDNGDKLERFISTLDRADYIFISSNRQWGTTTRVSERYPLTTVFYRALIGCPDGKDILTCYREAEPDSFSSDLGFDLVQVFTSYPRVGNWEINDQYAEEAFTVYDHPKVFIFQKNENYSLNTTREYLGGVDLSTVVSVVPGRAPKYPANLLLTEEDLERQKTGGTWSEIFNSNALYNRYPIIALILWYFVLMVLGCIVYPLVRIAMFGLADRGYPFVRIVALLLIAWIIWLTGSAGIAVNRGTISTAVIVLLGVNFILWRQQRTEIKNELLSRWRYYLYVEIFTAAFFILFLIIRLRNPDLWHWSYGGEKPMDFAYFNAVIRSTIFPPYNPWYAGGWINYYYYGFVLAGVPIKWLGIMPSIGYNLILPTFFSMLAMGGFSVGWNLLKSLPLPNYWKGEDRWLPPNLIALLGGLTSAIGLVLLGNLGTIRMIWQGMMKLAAPGGVIDGAALTQKIAWLFNGLGLMFNGARLPYATGEWYWIPSRAIPGDVITEFPFFTFLYADPHAHLFALPLTTLALGWILSLLIRRWNWQIEGIKRSWIVAVITIIFGAVTIGALRPTNTWDMPTYLTLAVVVIIYTAIKYAKPGRRVNWLPEKVNKAALGILIAGNVILLSMLFYQPFSNWYAQAYTSIDLWRGERSPLDSYLIHWGLFLMIIVIWLFWESVDWAAKTPLTHLRKLKPYIGALIAGAGVYLLLIVWLVIAQGVTTALLSLSIMLWAGLLILRPGQPDEKRLVLFLIGTAMALTLAVELIVLRGDVGRMNTVFKFYLQVWTLMAISSGVVLFWLFPAVLGQWKTGWRRAWQTMMVFFVTGALLFPLTASSAKIRDRMDPQAPHTLDGMAYMQTAKVYDQGEEIELYEDYVAIRWMQENVEGSPVIVEAQIPEYRWGSRFSIYTGLPTVLGWNWHQRQQRAILPDTTVWARVTEISNFYNTTNAKDCESFLDRYDIEYIIVGQLEGVYYQPSGLSKFVAWNGELWDEVFRVGQTVIYQVRHD